MIWAKEYSQITLALQNNELLRIRVIELIGIKPIADKATEGPGRIEALRRILTELADGKINQPVSFHRVENDLPSYSSMHRHNNRIFCSGWGERLVRTQLSRFYNL